MLSASFSRDARGGGVLPAGHFGNAALITVARLPPSTDTAEGGGGDAEGEAGLSELAGLVNTAVRHGPGVPQLAVPADVHFTSWWHPLQVFPKPVTARSDVGLARC